jgi:ATP-binding protein involved in chromosome partitioning
MAVLSEKEVLGALATIVDPDLGRDVVSLGMIKDLRLSEAGEVGFTFELTTPACPVRDRFKTMAEEAVGALPGVTAVDVKMTANVRPGVIRPQKTDLLPGVRQTIAVASGKGGVGKSTVAVNLAAALAKSGAGVGLLDADIYGPSVPGMTGSSEQPDVKEVRGPEGEAVKKLIPLQAYGLKLMSMGLLAGSDKAMVWRGPMVSKAIEQFMSDVHWGDLDYLVIDLPPGTGDASLTVAQRIPLTGVAIVATPQDIALDIAVKALQMFRSLNVTPLGLIENMSWFVCPDCGHEHHVFGHGGAQRAAQRLGVPFLGGIPLSADIREEADRGAPIVISQPDSVAARAFTDVASQIAARTSIQSFRRLPVINVR